MLTDRQTDEITMLENKGRLERKEEEREWKRGVGKGGLGWVREKEGLK